jgi:hypothetical protein
MDFDAPIPGSFYAAYPNAAPAIAPRPIAPRPNVSLLPLDGWSLCDHSCTFCLGRLIQHETGFVICSVCERMASTRDRKATTYRALCFCGIRVDGRIGRYRCAINTQPRPGDDGRIIPLFDGRRVYPLGERHHEHHEPPRTQPISGSGKSRNSASARLSKPRWPRVVVPPVSLDLPQSRPEPVNWWGPNQAS